MRNRRQATGDRDEGFALNAECFSILWFGNLDIYFVTLRVVCVIDRRRHSMMNIMLVSVTGELRDWHPKAIGARRKVF